MTSGTPGAPGNPDGAGTAGSTGATDSTGTADPTGTAHSTGTAHPTGATDSTEAGEAGTGAGAGARGGTGAAASSSAAAGGPRRRPPTVTTGTARPEGGGRAAPGDAPAPARQWPLLTVLGLAGLGLLVVGTDAFPQAFRIGAILIGAALLVGAVMRRVLPSVGMLAVRSRFTDMITYGVMGGLIVLLALMVQPEPWLQIPFLEDILHLTVT
ncbi:DUF3017 domain-containing protein [Streptomyces sp. NPDC058667]|uniref:DUF3017 domain-containing protein n=1 Tax=Streptomyces sp. NPDC058667 TaxID=3346588 RepID=UPI0036661D71